ncbi:MAG: tetratricopeptide repeat protein [Planctomycetes bacterium]|nr:tetratricopeptide repeat protein [Planctomycetota bacterium]
MMPSPHALARWLLCTVAAAATSSADLFAQAERPPEAVALAIGMQQRGLHEEAARYFGEFLAKNKSGPFVAEAQYRLGVSQVELGRGDAAIVSFTAALKGAGKDFVLRPECRYRLGNQLQAAKKFAAAAAQFEALRGEVGADHYLLAAAAYAEGECRRDAGEDKKAVVAFAAAAAAAKGEQAAYAFPALYQQGFGELRQQRYEAAAIAFAQAAPAAPDDNSRGECWFLCGDAALRIPDLDAAQQAFERAVAKPGDFVDDAWHGMGFVAIRRGDGAAARRCFAHVTDEHPDSPLLASARLEIARAWYRDGEQAKALAMLQKLLASNPGEDLGRQARELQGLCALAGGDAAAAVADLEKALAAASAADRPRLSVAVGEAYANLQQWDKALAAYQQVPEGAPVDLRGDALYGACFALHALGRFAESSERAGQLLKLQPRHRLADEAEFAVAENLFALQRYEEAEKAYVGFGSQQQRSAELRSKAAFKGAWCRYLRGDKKAAAAQFAAVSKQQSPFAEEALAMQALSLGEAGDDDAALATADQYLARYPQGAFVDRSQRVAARVLKQRGDLAGARRIFPNTLKGHVGVGAQLFMKATTEQVVDRLVHRLADEIPTGHLDGADRRCQHQAGVAMVMARRKDPLPEQLDIKRIGADHILFAEVFEKADLRRQLGAAARGPFTQADDPFVGDEFEKEPIAATAVGFDVVEDDRFKVDDLHWFCSWIGDRYFRPWGNGQV